MSEIVERARLRNVPYGWHELVDKMADEIERLQTDFDDVQAISLERLAEVERLRAENEQLGDHWNDVAHERNDLRAEIKRLRNVAMTEGDKMIAEIARLREELASIGRAKSCDEERIAEQDAEIERLRAINVELLTELKNIVPRFEKCMISHKNSVEVAAQNVANARAAIAKAEGSHERP